jgi:hypothetical protein
MSRYQRGRIGRGRAVMRFYRERFDEGEGDCEVLSDMLADLMHYVDAVNDPETDDLDFDFELERARRHHAYEVEEEKRNRSERR